jgi:hypothetical protein
VRDLKSWLDKTESLNGELEQLRGEVAKANQADRPDLDRLAEAADLLVSAGYLEDGKAKLVLLKERLDPQAALNQLTAELQSTLAEAVAQQPKETRDELVKFLDGACAAASSGNLQDAKAKVDDLKNRLDPVRKLKAENDLSKRIELAEKYLAGRTDSSKETVEVENILADAKKQSGVELAMKAYLAQFRGEEDTSLNPDGRFNLRHDWKVDDITAERMQEIMRDAGLGEAEVLAIATYSGEQYTIMNPAVANTKTSPLRGP